MPSGKNWIYFIYVNLALAVFVAGVFYFSRLQEIKANWPLYRCNPMYMPLADDINSNFVYCIQNMQTSFMGYLLEPLNFLTGSISGVLSSFLKEINMVRAMFDKIRTFISNIIQSVFGIFLNLIIEFQKIIIGMKDLMGKTIGIMVTMMYVMDGSVKTMNSMWNGPTGQMVRVLGKCFHPETNVKLKNGNIVFMKDLNLGDILENGGVVESTMKIDNKKNCEDLYKLEGRGVNGEDIYVTGSHLVYDDAQNKFIKVENYATAVKSNVKTDWFSCLITSDHNIKIGEELFWDWEDHFVKLNTV